MPCSSVSIVNFEQVNEGWVLISNKSLLNETIETGGLNTHVKLSLTNFTIIYLILVCLAILKRRLASVFLPINLKMSH